MEALSWNSILQAINTMALAAFAALLAMGKIVPLAVVKEHMIAPLQDRIQALERLSSKRDEQNAELQRMQAEAIKAQSQALEIYYQHKGGD